MKKRLIFFKQEVVSRPENADLPGMRKFGYFFKIYSNGTMFLDRTGTIRTPVAMKSFLPMPTFRTFDKTFEEICDARASELLERADRLGVRLYTFWSGGIDSTLVLVSLLKRASPAQKKNITVLMSEDSIAENPDFYRDHVHGALAVEPGIMAPYLLFGRKHLIVNGEHGDQLMGSDMVGKLIKKYGEKAINAPYKRETLFGLFDEMTGDSAMTNFYMDIFERIRAAAPMPIMTNHDFLWWINFSLKWQLVHTCILSFSSAINAPYINEEYRQTYFAPFFCTDDFQLWSMNNLDKRIKDTWKSYKWVSKEIIYGYTKDANYRDNKTKYGSRVLLLLFQDPFRLIDESYHFYRSGALQEFHEPDNDFL